MSLGLCKKIKNYKWKPLFFIAFFVVDVENFLKQYNESRFD